MCSQRIFHVKGVVKEYIFHLRIEVIMCEILHVPLAGDCYPKFFHWWNVQGPWVVQLMIFYWNLHPLLKCLLPKAADFHKMTFHKTVQITRWFLTPYCPAPFAPEVGRAVMGADLAVLGLQGPPYQSEKKQM